MKKRTLDLDRIAVETLDMGKSPGHRLYQELGSDTDVNGCTVLTTCGTCGGGGAFSCPPETQ